MIALLVIIIIVLLLLLIDIKIEFAPPNKKIQNFSYLSAPPSNIFQRATGFVWYNEKKQKWETDEMISCTGQKKQIINVTLEDVIQKIEGRKNG